MLRRRSTVYWRRRTLEMIRCSNAITHAEHGFFVLCYFANKRFSTKAEPAVRQGRKVADPVRDFRTAGLPEMTPLGLSRAARFLFLGYGKNLIEREMCHVEFRRLRRVE